MAGLGTPIQEQAAPPEQAGTQQAPSSKLPSGEMDMEEPTPEEQAQFEKFERTMLALVYPEATPGEVSAPVLDNLRGNFDPSALEMFEPVEPALTDSPQDSAAATAVLMTLLVEQQGGEKFGDDVVLHGGKSVIEELIEVSEAAKIHDFSEQDIETVTYRAMDLYRIASPRVNVEALTAEFETLKEASAAGTLGNVLPGLPGGPPMAKGA